MSVMLASVITEEDTNESSNALGVLASGRNISVIGGSEPDDDSDDDDDETDDDDSEDENDDEDPDTGKTEEELRAELKKLRGTVKNQRKSEREARKEAARLKAEGGGKKKTRKTSEEDDDEDTEGKITSAREEAAKERDAAWKKRYVHKAAVAALASAGFTGKNPARFAKANITVEDLEDLEVDDDGEVDGLEDLIRDLKRENREQFVRRAPGNVNTGDDDDEGSGKAKNGSKTTSALTKLISGTTAAKRSTAKSRNKN